MSSRRERRMEIIKGLPSTSQDDYQMNVTTLVKHVARSLGQQKIVQRGQGGDSTVVTYEEIYTRIQRLANALAGFGLGPGDVVGVLDWNSLRHYELQFGIPGLGSAVLQMNPRLFPQQLAYVANHSKPRLIAVDESLIPIAESISSQIEGVEGYIIMTDRDPASVQTVLEPLYSYEEIINDSEPEYDFPMIDEKSAAFICYTSGTTGNPKGVYFSHRNIYLHAMQSVISLEFTNRDSVLVLPPMFHCAGWGMPQMATLVGCKLVLPGMYSLEDIDSLVKLMQDERVSIAFGATTFFMSMLEGIRKMKKKPDFSSTTILSGATEPPLSMMRDYYELTGATVCQGYGATETTPMVTVNRVKPWMEDKLSLEEKWMLRSKHGYPVIGIDMKIVNESGEELPHDGKSVGEILVKGPWVAGSYHDAPGTEDRFTDDGYWKSGDVGYIDNDEYLKLVDRIKDLVKSGGEWISSVDMENEIIRHPAVLEATVVGVPHPKWDERPLAFVVLREEEKQAVSAQDIRDLLSETFAKWQLPDKVFFVDEIPKTSVGKYDKKVLRAEYKDIFMDQSGSIKDT